jgi:hypothetical protein
MGGKLAMPHSPLLQDRELRSRVVRCPTLVVCPTCRRVVLHDWTDADVVRILKNLHKTMAGTTARLILVEQVVAVPQDHITVHYIMDLHMHVAFGGKERTRVEWRDLLKQGGFEMKDVKDTRSIFSVIESVPV